jgi:hypothetical protein
MESFREARCRICRTLFYVCRRCDRGQAYCGVSCRRAGRRAVLRIAKQKYRTHELVRADERDRMRAYRARVRDQGSQEVVFSASLPAAATSAPMVGAVDGRGDIDASKHEPVDALRATGEIPCAVCGRRARFVRFGWLRAARSKRHTVRARAP